MHKLTRTALAIALVAAACGGDDTADDTTDEPTATVDDQDGADQPDDTDAPDDGDDQVDDVDDQDDPSTDDLDQADEAAGPDLETAVTLTEVATMESPIAGDVGPDGTLYVADRTGTVHPLVDDELGDPVVDITDMTTTDSERGLLGIAFADDGDELYLSFTDIDGDTQISAVAVDDGDFGDDLRDIYWLEQPEANHNGGDIAVGPDGMLYIAMGDGGGAGDPIEAGQDLTTALGALLRIDPAGADPYEVPDDNPFVDEDDAVDEIYSYGLRNPWRFSFDADTDELYIADVGQDAREEVNVVTLDEASGANFGWNLMEGTLEFDGQEPDDHVAPVYEYDTGGDEGCAITGGYVYRGAAIESLDGAYLYSDSCNGDIRALDVTDGEVEQASLGVDGGMVVAFTEDADGEIYVLDLGGTVYRVEPA